MTLWRKGSVFLIAEIAQAHDGSLGNALAFIDACAAAGASAVKFQDHRADPCDKFRPGTEGNFPQDATRQDYWKRTSFTGDEWVKLRHRAESAGVAFGVSPFSLPAVASLSPLVDFWKVGSGQLGNVALRNAIVGTGKPAIYSSGLSRIEELPTNDWPILQCTTAYPTTLDMVGLNVLAEFKSHWPHRPLGLSDHSGTIWPSLAAAALGAEIIEVHVCWDRRQFGPDTTSSITIDELAKLVEGVRAIETMRANPVDKNAMADRLMETRRAFDGTH